MRKNTDPSLRGELSWKRLRTSAVYPKLNAKAAITKHLAVFALDLAGRHCEDRRIIAIAQLLVEFYSLIEREGLIMGPDVLRRILVVGQNLCMLYAQLARDSFVAGLKVWKMSPKFNICTPLPVADSWPEAESSVLLDIR